MRIFAIGDLHLSGQPPQKPMTIFGSHWENHWERIRENGLARVSEDDLVLLAGDLSWGMRLADALPDLLAVADLPGKKILIRGNHDYWWQTLGKMNTALSGRLHFLQNNFFPADEIAVCGSRGWLLPDDPQYTTEDEAIRHRELMRTEASLKAAAQAGFHQTLLMLHYPPLYSTTTDSDFSRLCRQYQVRHCLYGHLHGDGIAAAFEGEKDGTCYHLVSADALNFQLKEITW